VFFRPVRSTDVHRTCTQPRLVGRSTGRSTVQRALLSGNGPGRPAESCCSLYPVPVDRRHNGQKSDRWGGRPEGQNCPFQLPAGRFILGLYILHFLSYFKQVFREQNFQSLQVFNSKFLKEFLGLKDHSLFVLKCWKIQRKREYLGIGF